MKYWIFLSFLLLCVAFPASAGKPRDSASPPTTAPGFNLPTDTGSISLDSLRGKVVYVDFWASWCVPCRMSFPWLRTLHERYAAKGLAIVAVNLDKNRDAASAFLEEFPSPFIVAFDPAGKTAESYNVSAMPSSYLIGPTGAILHSQAGFDPRETGRIETLIKEACSR